MKAGKMYITVVVSAVFVWFVATDDRPADPRAQPIPTAPVQAAESANAPSGTEPVTVRVEPQRPLGSDSAARPSSPPAVIEAAPPLDTVVLPPPQEQDTIRARYPTEWEVAVPSGTPLDSLRGELDRQIDILPARDLEDETPLPIWFRVYLRKQHPDLPTDGPYQYPRTAQRMLQWLLAHPDSVGSGSP